MAKIEGGEADGHLSAVYDAEVDYRDRTSVTNALESRGDLDR